ncbi:MAG TPA: aspartyl protease family protein [Saprospiraceae bacterium]|nr:aspartyl protease family protein [Saprospiraceae bacterium]
MGAVVKYLYYNWFKVSFGVFILLIMPYMMRATNQNHPLLGSQNEIVLPFDYHQGFIIVDIIFHKKIPLKFILDTGAENTVLLKKQYAEILKIPYSKRIKLLGSDMNRDVFARVCNSIYLQLVNTQTIKSNIIVLEEDMVFLEEFIGKPIDGILGAEFFRGLILKINYKRMEITVSDPNTYNYKKLNKHQSFDIEIINSKPYLNCKTSVLPGKETVSKLLLDTGASLTTMFHNNTDSMLMLPKQIIKGNLGKGLGGEINGFVGKVHKLNLGTFEFNNLVSSFQDLEDIVLKADKVIRNGLIGNHLLERFDVVLDLHHSKLYLKAHKNYNKDFEYDKSGITLYAFGEHLNEYYIRHIVEGSPADVAGLQPGDIIKKVGFWSYRWLNINKINKKLAGKVGKEITFKVLRNGQKLSKTIILRDLLDDKRIEN